MKYLLLLLGCFMLTAASAQTDSVANPASVIPRHIFTQRDTLYMAKLNNSGNLMIAGGVGLCGAGSFLIYEGVKTYSSPVDPTTAAADQQRNHRQGTIYIACGGIAIAGGIALVAFGARNKVDFKIRKKYMSLQSGILENGKPGLALNF